MMGRARLLVPAFFFAMFSLRVEAAPTSAQGIAMCEIWNPLEKARCSAYIAGVLDTLQIDAVTRPQQPFCLGDAAMPEVRLVIINYIRKNETLVGWAPFAVNIVWAVKEAFACK